MIADFAHTLAKDADETIAYVESSLSRPVKCVYHSVEGRRLCRMEVVGNVDAKHVEEGKHV